MFFHMKHCVGSHDANKSYQSVIKSSSEHAWFDQRHSISLYFLLPQRQAVPRIIKEGCMKELIKYYTPRISAEIYLKWNCKVMRKRRDGHGYQGVNFPINTNYRIRNCAHLPLHHYQSWYPHHLEPWARPLVRGVVPLGASRHSFYMS